MHISTLKPGVRYAFTTKAWPSPDNELIPGETKVRTFIEVQHLGAIGLTKTPFLTVAREDGTPHQIAVETLEAIALG